MTLEVSCRHKQIMTTPLYMILADASNSRRRSGKAINAKENLAQAKLRGWEEYLFLRSLITI